MEETYPMAFQSFTGLNMYISNIQSDNITLFRLDENLIAKCPPQYLADPVRIKEAVARVNNIETKK